MALNRDAEGVSIDHRDTVDLRTDPDLSGNPYCTIQSTEKQAGFVDYFFFFSGDVGD
jgi:hypothetical protein